jgi:hypothetical protein
MFHVKIFGLVLFFGAAVSCSNPDPEISSMDFIRAGDSISLKTFDTLSRTLQKAVATGGFEEAINACKQMAPGLTGTYNNTTTTIERTAIRVRNEANAPNSLEKSQLEFFHNLVTANEPVKPKLVVDEKGTVHYFKPILIQPLCLNCHGSEDQDISAALLARLKQEYPNDEATGYAMGDLRGLWHITFNPFPSKN